MRVPTIAYALTFVLGALVAIDGLTTIVGVGFMGATELNPVAVAMGFPAFIVLKIAVSVVCIYVMYRYCIPACPSTSCLGTAFLVVMYSIICASNLYHIAGQLI